VRLEPFPFPISPLPMHVRAFVGVTGGRQCTQGQSQTLLHLPLRFAHLCAPPQVQRLDEAPELPLLRANNGAVQGQRFTCSLAQGRASFRPHLLRRVACAHLAPLNELAIWLISLLLRPCCHCCLPLLALALRASTD